MVHYKGLAREVLESGRTITNYEDLRKIALRMGYPLESSKEGFKVYSKRGDIITVIPRNNNLNKYTAKGILIALRDAESTFRNNGAHEIQ